MPVDLKIQVVFAIVLAMELLGLFMILIRTVANLEYAFNRTEEIVHREVQLSMRFQEQERLTKEKAEQTDNRGQRNELLLNIPFMERLTKEKKKDG